jgi:hypothetical protein
MRPCDIYLAKSTYNAILINWEKNVIRIKHHKGRRAEG